MKGSKAAKEREVEKLAKDLQVSSPSSFLGQAVRADLAKAKSALEKKERAYKDQEEELKTAEDEIDELKKLLNVAKSMRKKSMSIMASQMTNEQQSELEGDAPDGCKQS